MSMLNPDEIERELRGVDYPARKRDLIQQAQDNDANPRVIEALKRLPEQDFDGPMDVAQAISDSTR